MSKIVLVSLALCFLLVSFHGCLGQERRRFRPSGRSHQFRGQSECQLNRLNALEPTNRIECEAGLIEAWDNNNDEFQCAGVALVRHTIEPSGLLLPSFTNAPQLIYITEGVGIQGTVIPGCPETYQSSQQQSPFEGRGREFRGEEGGRFQDQHQKIRRFRQGDILALPAGVAHWIYNDGNRPLRAVVLLDVTNNANQLDLNPRRFFLAGNPEDVHQQGRRESRPFRRGEGEGEGQRFGSCNNLFCGFDVRLLAQAFNVDEETARRLQSENDNRNNIVKVQGGLQVLRPPSGRGFEEYEEERERYQYRERERRMNGLEETLCTMRLRENIGSPLRADIYTRRAGHLSTLNSHNLPILNWLQLSAERGHLHSNAIMVPHYNMNSHSIVYVTRGRARVQIVNDNGENVFDEELREGQVVVVPQNFAVVKRAESEGFEWISFKTNDNAMITPLAGRTSFLRALPDEVVANAYQISKEDAKELKYNRKETFIFRSPGRGFSRSESERRADA